MSGWRWDKKATVEGHLALDTADLKRLNLLTPSPTERAGVLRWHAAGEERPRSAVGYRLAVGSTSGTLRLIYAVTTPKADFDYPVALVATPCHLGGVRWWFRCPLARNGAACGRRVKKLYLRTNYFGCRHCHQLTYTSQQQSDSRVYAALRRGDHLNGVGDVANMSVRQLGFALKLMTAGRKRLDRLERQLDRPARSRGPRQLPTETAPIPGPESDE